jgi:DNA recombination protein RmuC
MAEPFYLSLFVVAITCAVISSIIILLHRRNIRQLKKELNETRLNLENSRAEKNKLQVELAALTTENRKNQEFHEARLNELKTMQDSMKESFSLLSQESVRKGADLMRTSFNQSLEQFYAASERERIQNSESLKNVVLPLRESLQLVDKKVQNLEEKREGAYVSIAEQIKALIESQAQLQKETGKLARALHAPTIRGRWGEIQLRRVVELSGMSPYCDFLEQSTISSDDAVARPDMIITLPKNKKIVIDAKVPIDFFGTEESEEGGGSSPELAASLRRHLLQLKKKSYFSLLDESPEFTVMFLPSELFLHRAMRADPNLLELAAQNDVVIATPLTLIALLKGIALAFKHQAVAENIEEVRRLSHQLIERIQKVAEHFERLGKSLRQASESYNQALSSIDSRVLVSARKLAALGVLSDVKEDAVIKVPEAIDSFPKAVPNF